MAPDPVQRTPRPRRWSRFMDWPLRAKMAALLMVVSVLPLGVAAAIDFREGHGGRVTVRSTPGQAAPLPRSSHAS